MSDMLISRHELHVALTIGEWAGRLHIDSGDRAAKIARSAATALAEDIAAISMFPLPKSVAFRGIAGKAAHHYVETFG